MYRKSEEGWLIQGGAEHIICIKSPEFGGEGDTPGDHLGPPGDHPHSGLYTI